MSLRYHFTAEERAEYGRKMRARRARAAAWRAAHPQEAGRRQAERDAEQAERERIAAEALATVMAMPRTCLGWDLVDGRIVRHLVGQSPVPCERCAGHPAQLQAVQS